MKLGCFVLLAAGIFMVRPASAQVSAYGEFTAAKLTNLVDTNILYGPTVGFSGNRYNFKHVNVGADLRGNFLGGKQRLDGLAFGGRLEFPVKKYVPYIEGLAGFARYNDGKGQIASATTDGQFQAIVGVDRQLTPRFDIRFEYGYEEYYALGGQFNPKNFSTGAVYHFKKR